MDHHSISAGGMTARIKADGAELCSLTAPDGTELIWQAHPVWPRHSPILFPIVGTLTGNHLHHDGSTYDMGRHGFARDRRFAWTSHSATACQLTLSDDVATRAIYPFPFRFDVIYEIATGTGLTITYRIGNPGPGTLPASMGAHPAFNWPLRPGLAKTDHTIIFEHDEPAPIRRVSPDGLLREERLASPIIGTHMLILPNRICPNRIMASSVTKPKLAPGVPAPCGTCPSAAPSDSTRASPASGATMAVRSAS